MCGISGYVGTRSASEVLLTCLARLEYRGYDSAGIALQVSGGIANFREVGPVENLRTTGSLQVTESHVGVGHTRWATHGAPRLENTHPLVSCDGSFAVVHNGVIENHRQLRAELEQAGHRFSSETDSEVIPHLVEAGISRGQTVLAAFAELPDQLLGSFAIVGLHRDLPGLLVTRRSSPLVVGVGEGEYFVASDIPSFLPYTSRVLYLRENETLTVELRGVRRLSSRPSDGEISPDLSLAATAVELDIKATSKGDFDHFMIKEILEQAEVLANTLEGQRDQLDWLATEVRGASHVLVTGMGSSYHSAIFAEQLASELGLWNVRSVVSSDIDQFDTILSPSTLVIALSQSGETADTLAGIRHARTRGAKVWGLLNAQASSIGASCDRLISMRCGPELAVAATKSYIAQLSLLTQILFGAVRRDNDAVRFVRDSHAALYNLTSDSVRQHIRRLAEELVESPELFVLGRRFESVTAREGALKLKEVAGLRAEALLSTEMKHGPLALIESGSGVLMIYRAADRERAQVTGAQLAARGARVFTVGPEALPASSWHVQTPDVGTGMPMIQIVPIQLLSYELARLRKLNPDRPPNLAKSVTVA